MSVHQLEALPGIDELGRQIDEVYRQAGLANTLGRTMLAEQAPVVPEGVARGVEIYGSDLPKREPGKDDGVNKAIERDKGSSGGRGGGSGGNGQGSGDSGSKSQ